MLKMLTVILVLAGFVSGGSFSRIFPASEPWYCSPLDVRQLAGGPFAMTQADVMDDAVLFLLDQNGELIVEQSVMRAGNRSLESGGWILPLSDGGCFVCSYSEPRATGVDSDIALFRLSADGGIEWKALIGDNSEEAYSGLGAAASRNGGCAVLGTWNYEYDDAFLRMYSSSGSVLWQRDFNEFENYYPIAVYPAGEGFLVLLGHEWEETAMVLRMGLDGVREWSSEIPYDCGFGASAVTECSRGFMVYLSLTNNRSEGLSALLDFEGNVLETTQFSHDVEAYDALVTAQGSIILAGYRNIDGEEGAAIEALDFHGEPIWSRRMDSIGEGCFTAVSESSDGGYCLWGSINPMDEGDPCCTMFVKTGPEGIMEDSADPSVIPLPVDVIEAPSLCLGWVVACGVFGTESEAFERAVEVYTEVEVGLPESIWIPDWGSLSGYEGWLACLSCMPQDGLTDEQAAEVLAICPDSYMVWVGINPIPEGRMSLSDFN